MSAAPAPAEVEEYLGFTVDLKWDKAWGPPEAVVVRNNCRSEFYLNSITLEGVPEPGDGDGDGGAAGKRLQLVCNSWLYPAANYSDDRIFVNDDSLKEKVLKIKGLLRKMEDGEISISPYDTAWLSLVRDANNGDKPWFPESLQWIVQNQLSDGSWGDDKLFEPYERIINTLACLIALSYYRQCPHNCHKGMVFLRENMHKIEDGVEEHMPIGFEIAFPSLIDIAQRLGLELPLTTTSLQHIYDLRCLKIKRIPMDVMHEVPTTLLCTLEGMAAVGDHLDWKRLLPLRCEDGSFLGSPSSTAFAFLNTGDPKSLEYLEKVTARFSGGAPTMYPVDLFERLWVVDRLQRLGIARHFEPEMEHCLDYAFKHWKEDGIEWATGCPVNDVDDTAMGFRLLRLHGYHVSPDAFRSFQENGEFFCFAGQSSQSVTAMFNLYRAAQVAFPGEKILEEARCFSTTFLREKQRKNQLLDKWIISKDLQGEVKYALDFPWVASLPRVETREYLEQYGGEDDIWIGKTLYRMPLVNNNAYLELAKSDFNRCQAVHQQEWFNLRRWLDRCGLSESTVVRCRLAQAYFVAACSMFEPERSCERLGWARTAVIAEAVREHLGRDKEMKLELIKQLHPDHDCKNGNGCRDEKMGALVDTIQATIHKISSEVSPANHQTMTDAHSRQIILCLQHAWAEWIMTIGEGDDEILLLCRTLELCAGRYELERVMPGPLFASSKAKDENTCSKRTHGEQHDPSYARAVFLVTSVCRRLQVGFSKIGDNGSDLVMSDMQELVQCVLEKNSKREGRETMQTFLAVAKSFFYVSHCPAKTMEKHIAKVLFQRVL